MGQGDFADEVQKEEDEEESEEDFVPIKHHVNAGLESDDEEHPMINLRALTDHDPVNMKSQEMIEDDESPLAKQLPEAPLIDLQTQAINF